MRETPDLTPAPFVIAELPRADLVQSSGVYDEALGRDLTNFEAIDMIEKLVHPEVQVVWVDDSKYLSRKARQVNTALNRMESPEPVTPDQLIVAVVSQRPTSKQRSYAASMTRLSNITHARQHLPVRHDGGHGTTHDHGFDDRHTKANLHR
ncbi:MAG: hypothetical protein ABIQ89_01460 [Candidatus Saccharimonadales bacterium]